MAPKEFDEAKRKMMAQAGAAIRSIQAAGKQGRAEISTLKTAVIEQVETYSQQEQQAQETFGEQRFELIQRLGEAVRAGDVLEMERLRKLLEEGKNNT